MRLHIGVSLRSLEFSLGRLNVKFVVDEEALEQIFLHFFLFSVADHHFTVAPYSLSPPHEVCDSPDHSADYHNARFLSWGLHPLPGTLAAYIS
jgi:hypothetical protein